MSNQSKLTNVYSFLKNIFSNENEMFHTYSSRIPNFDLNFNSTKNFIDILEKLKYGGSLIEGGEIISYDRNKIQYGQLPCYIIFCHSIKYTICQGLGFYNGSEIITAKHNFKNYNKNYIFKKYNIFVLFPTIINCLIYKTNYKKIFFEKVDIARIQLTYGQLPNIKPIEIIKLYENEESFYFYKLNAGNFKQIKCRKINPERKKSETCKLKPNEFAFDKTGNYGDSGTPIFTSSGKCVGMYVSCIQDENLNNKPLYGIALCLD